MQMPLTQQETGNDADTASDESYEPAPKRSPRDGVTGVRAPGQRISASRWAVPVLSALLGISVMGNAVMAWQLRDQDGSVRAATAELSAAQANADARKQAEQVSIDYAKGAADMDYKNLPAWSSRLTSNTTPELKKKLTDAATSMEQIIVPLQWVSTPTPLAATVRSEHDGVYVVNCFVSVITKNIQAPNGIQSTATYTVTVNKNDNWVITDVGGVDSATKLGK
ncbi:hypothetical protein BKG69_13160 [Mycobacteroides chelonae]|nr:hypothetical protein BKG69_13160 [Mycobacteroides chelonae]